MFAIKLQFTFCTFIFTFVETIFLQITFTTNTRDILVKEVTDIALTVDVEKDIIIMTTEGIANMAVGLTSMIAILIQDAVSHVSINKII